MVRAPCCEKMGLKRGPWTPEEDQVLVAFIQRYGHGNWRALPKQAGLLRCGKSCRLRWTNYLRPDIKRGNFSNEEEEAIIKLHEMLGNRWSAIAARLPGRTDNEIKNVWHTHLKKRLKTIHPTSPKQKSIKRTSSEIEISNKSEHVNFQPEAVREDSNSNSNSNYSSVSPQESCSDFTSSADTSSVITVDNHINMGGKDEIQESSEANELSDNFFDIDENFWRDTVVENMDILGDFSSSPNFDAQLQSSFSSLDSSMDDGMSFWFDLFIQAGDQPVAPEF